MFGNWEGTITINGTLYEVNHLIDPKMKIEGPVNILLTPRNFTDKQTQSINDVLTDDIKITVKSYMTKKASPDFDFMAKWNDNKPMPLRTMVGKKLKETSGMVYMELHGDITQEITQFCMKCGKPITNPVSQYFGMGPECGQHNYVNPFSTKEELKEHVESYKKQLQNIKWSGWIIKSAIISEEDVDGTN